MSELHELRTVAMEAKIAKDKAAAVLTPPLSVAPCLTNRQGTCSSSLRRAGAWADAVGVAGAGVRPRLFAGVHPGGAAG
jgi:hypothetical protein